jgi:hypothetical protein
VALAAACSSPAPPFDPLAQARVADPDINLEAAIPPACYARTDGGAGACWTCHTAGVGPNTLDDADLQGQYAFSDAALDNRWTNLFAAQRDDASDDEILAWIRRDNYGPVRGALAAVEPALDLDLARGFDDDGFARDGSGWRAVRYQPFPGISWPDTGSLGDVFVRLPDEFRSTGDGLPSRAVYRLNLAILEAAIAGAHDPTTAALDREVEPVDERIGGFDLDGDGALREGTARIRRLPPRYAGGAAGIAVEPLVYPLGTELLHSVRYVDPDAPALMATRMKELRWMRKVEAPDSWGRLRAYEREADEKEEGLPPRYRGDAIEGLVNAFGWRLRGFIEDAGGRLRVQTEEEHRFCMGCHQGIGVTVDSTFSIARKVPGAGGWRPQDLRGLVDRPQIGHSTGEVATYLARLHRPVPAGDDLVTMLAPSREVALDLARAYRAIVRAQSFERGRDAVIAPASGFHRRISTIETGLPVRRDGRLHLIW